MTAKEFSIKTKITLFMVLFISAVLASFSLLVLKTGRDIIMDEVRQRGVIISRNLASNISGYLLTNATLDCIQLLARARESKGVVYALVAGEKGRIIAHNDTSLIGGVFELKKTGKSGRETQWQDAVVSGQKVLDFTAPVNASKGVFLGNVHLGISRSLISEMLWRMYAVLIIISILSLAVAIAGSVAMGIAFTRPIEALAAGAGKMGEGGLEHRVEIKSNDEFGRLAAALNKMAQDLKSAHEAEIDMQKFEVEKLKELDIIKSNFISVVSHELKTPLAVIKGVISILSSEKTGPINTKQADFIETMTNNVNKLELIFNDLVDISMMEKGKFQITMTKFDINALIKEVIRDMSVVVAEYNVSLVYEEDSRPGEIRNEVFVNADRGRIAQVLTNLVNNAVKFSSQKTTVRIGVQKDGFSRDNRHVLDMMDKGRDCIMIYVKDQGLGLDKEQLERVFDRFYQVEKASTRSHGGIGMGLSIARNIIYIHDGDIWAESEGKGKGTTFRILLPRGA